MGISRTWLHLSAVVLLPLALVHCSDDDDAPAPQPAAGKSGANTGGAGTGGAGGSTAGANQGGAGAAQGGAGTGQGGAGANQGGAGMGGAGNTGAFTQVKNVTTGATGFVSPLDAVPSPDGATIYFTAFLADGSAGVFKVAAAGGAVTEVAKGGELVSPTGLAITGSGNTLIIADPGALEPSTDPKVLPTDKGRVFAVSTAGGTPEALTGLSGLNIRSVQVAKLKDNEDEKLFFAASGSDGVGVYSSPTTGGVATIVAAGGPFNDPSGIAVQTGGKIYVADAVSPGGLSRILEISGSTASVFVERVWLGYPAGLALSADGKLLHASARDAKGASTVLSFDTGTKAPSGTLVNAALKGLVEPGGMHRALSSGTVAWVDGVAGGTGAVFVLAP